MAALPQGKEPRLLLDWGGGWAEQARGQVQSLSGLCEEEKLFLRRESNPFRLPHTLVTVLTKPLYIFGLNLMFQFMKVTHKH